MLNFFHILWFVLVLTVDYSSIASSISEMDKLLDSDPSIYPTLRMSIKNNLQLYNNVCEQKLWNKI